MSRSDGLPTNREMLVDFNAFTCDIYASAFERTVANGMPPAFEGKSLAHLLYGYAKSYPKDAHSPVPHPIAHEKLKVSPLEAALVPYFEHDPAMQDIPADVLQRYKFIAATLLQTELQPGISIRETLPLEAVDADYSVWFFNTRRTRHVSTYKERPAKQTIASGVVFAEEALDFVKSDGFDADPIDLLFRDGPDQPIVRHGFRFSLIPELALNGQESTDFLDRYSREMSSLATMYARQIEDWQRLEGPESFIARIRKKQERAHAAEIRARAFLQGKSIN